MLATVRNNRGFTGLELLLSLALLIVIVGIAYEFMIYGQKAALKTRDSFMSQSQLRAGIDNMTDEIRWAQYIQVASGNSVSVFIPQSTPFSPSSPYFVTFAYDSVGKRITRQQGSSWPITGTPLVPVAYNIVKADGTAGLSLDYYRGDGTVLTQPIAVLSDIKRVRLTVYATTNQTTRTFVGDATPRTP